jgi:hypothetical protein
MSANECLQATVGDCNCLVRTHAAPGRRARDIRQPRRVLPHDDNDARYEVKAREVRVAHTSST